jgi:hypothetical protein
MLDEVSLNQTDYRKLRKKDKVGIDNEILFSPLTWIFSLRVP